MDVREKLVELFHQHNAKYVTFCDNCFEDDAEELNDKMLHLSDHLIAHGVTVQEWISVKDRLPKRNTEVLVYRPKMAMPILVDRYECYYGEDDNVWHEGWAYSSNCTVTAWMPLPQPPKGEGL